MDTKEHDCIQEKRLDAIEKKADRLEDKTDRLDNKIDKIMEMQMDIKSTIAKVLTRLDKKHDDDKERNKKHEQEDSRMDRIEIEQASQRTQNKIIITLLLAILASIAGYVVSWLYKTLILGI